MNTSGQVLHKASINLPSSSSPSSSPSPQDEQSSDYLTNYLEDANDVLEVANVEDRQLQLNVAIVTSAVGQGLTACLTHGILGARTLATGDASHMTWHVTLQHYIS